MQALAGMILLMTLTGCANTGMASADTGTQTAEQGSTIAVLAPLSGAGATYGKPFVFGMQMAIDEANGHEGPNRTRMRLIVEDTKLDPKTSLDAVQKLLTFDDPDLFSVMFAPPALAAGPVLDAAKKPFIYDAYIRSPLNLSYAFKAGFDALTGCESLIRYAKTHGKYQKLGVMMAQAEYSDLCIQGIKRVEPDIKEYRYNFGETDFKTILMKAYNDGADSLVMIGFDFEFTAMFRQLSELGYPIKILCTTTSECIIPEVKRLASPKTLEGTLSIDFVPQNILATLFGKRYTERFGAASPTDLAYSAAGYEEGMIITQAIRACKPKDTECLKGALERAKGYKSVIGSDGFNDHVLSLKTNVYEYGNGEWEQKDSPLTRIGSRETPTSSPLP